MSFRVCFEIDKTRRCIDLPVISIRFLWPHPPEEHFKLINPELTKELVLLSQIHSLASQLQPELKDRLSLVVEEYVGQSLPALLPSGVQVSIQQDQN